MQFQKLYPVDRQPVRDFFEDLFDAARKAAIAFRDTWRFRKALRLFRKPFGPPELWVLARNKKGQRAMLPSCYVAPRVASTSAPSSSGRTLSPEECAEIHRKAQAMDWPEGVVITDL